MKRLINILYYAQLRDLRGVEEEQFKTDHNNVSELYAYLRDKYEFTLSSDQMRVAVNDHYVDWDYEIKDKDKIIFIPPVSGG